ncbi:MAG: hypothetical protein MI810_15575 [Flavobacteriales bacterium]|nr:hypothetical protein [Flavobacteriales bacterium]
MVFILKRIFPFWGGKRLMRKDGMAVERTDSVRVSDVDSCFSAVSIFFQTSLF